MKKVFNRHSIKAVFAAILVLLVNIAVQAQEEITVDTGEAKSWLSENWMWVAGGVLLLIILLAAGSSRTRKTTTVRDNVGGTTTTTTTVSED